MKIRLIIISCVIIFIIALSFALKPLIVKKSNQFLAKNTLIGYYEAEVLTPRSPIVHLKLGQEFQRRGNFEKAKKEFQIVKNLCTKRGCPEYKEADFNLKKDEAQNALKNGEIEKAKAPLAEALKLNPSDSETQFDQGLLLISQGNYNEAKKVLQVQNTNQAQILLSSLEKSSSLITAAALLKINYPNLAIILLEKTVKESPNYRDAYIYLGKAYQAQPNLDKAVEAFQKAAEIDPIYPKTFLLLSETYQKMNKPDEAKKLAEKVKMLEWKNGL